MRKLIFAFLIFLLAAPCFGMQTNYRRIEPEVVVYQGLPNAVQSQFATNEIIKTVKFNPAGVLLSSLPGSMISNAAGYTFISPPPGSPDLRLYSGFHALLTSTGTLACTLGAVGTGETTGTDMYLGFNFTSLRPQMRLLIALILSTLRLEHRLFIKVHQSQLIVLSIKQNLMEQ